MQNWLESFFVAAEVLGTIAFAAAGAMIAIDREMDMFGVLFLGVTAAVGGGMVRDVLLGVTPPTAFRNPLYVAVAAPVALAVFLFAWLSQRQYRRGYAVMGQVVNLLDAIGLGVFSVIGVEAALARGHRDNLFLLVFMGMTTGIGGGVLRDIFSQTIPAVLKKRIYALASIAGSLLYCLQRRAGLSEPLATGVSMAAVVAIRMCSTYFRWDLPVVKREPDAK